MTENSSEFFQKRRSLVKGAIGTVLGIGLGISPFAGKKGEETPRQESFEGNATPLSVKKEEIVIRDSIYSFPIPYYKDEKGEKISLYKEDHGVEFFLGELASKAAWGNAQVQVTPEFIHGEKMQQIRAELKSQVDNFQKGSSGDISNASYMRLMSIIIENNFVYKRAPTYEEKIRKNLLPFEDRIMSGEIDCKDFAVLTSLLAAEHGIYSQIAVIDYKDPGLVSHTITIFDDNGEPFVSDLTYSDRSNRTRPLHEYLGIIHDIQKISSIAPFSIIAGDNQFPWDSQTWLAGKPKGTNSTIAEVVHP